MTDAPERLADERLDELERLTHVRNYYIPVAVELLASLIAELRAARAPVEPGVVTRAHRDAAAAALYPMRDDRPELPLGVWVTTGNGNLGHEPVRVAQAIANAEARGASRAAPPADLTAEVEELRRKVRGVKATCRQCGDTLAKCMSQPGLCCIGCNHASYAPPADEVAGLTRDVDAVRDAISFARSKLNGYTTLGLDLTYALDRIENHLKGKR